MNCLGVNSYLYSYVLGFILHMFVTRVTRRVSHVERELLTILEHRTRKSKSRQFNGQRKTGQKDKQRSKKNTLPKN
jgi:hypothetical protein